MHSAPILPCLRIRTREEIDEIRDAIGQQGMKVTHVSALRDAMVVCVGPEAEGNALGAALGRGNKGLRSRRRLLLLDETADETFSSSWTAPSGGSSSGGSSVMSEDGGGSWPGSLRSLRVAEALSESLPVHLAEMVTFIAPLISDLGRPFSETGFDGQAEGADGGQQRGRSLMAEAAYGHGRSQEPTASSTSLSGKPVNEPKLSSTEAAPPSDITAVSGGLSLNISGPYPGTTLQAGSDTLGLWQVSTWTSLRLVGSMAGLSICLILGRMEDDESAFLPRPVNEKGIAYGMVHMPSSPDNRRL